MWRFSRLTQVQVIAKSPDLPANMAPIGIEGHDERVVAKRFRSRPSARKLFSIDITKPMVAQVGHLGADYDKWVHDPVRRKEQPRLFHSNLAEVLTKCKWWMIPIIWGPVVVWCECKSVSNGLPQPMVPLGFVSGLLFWTLLEYILHRFVFHMKASSYWVNKLHYVIHGFHHKHPMDGDRLVFPPLYTAVICLFIWWMMDLVLTPTWKPSIYGGALFGYICYDLTHYFLHFGTPFTHFHYKMKKQHYNHHYKNDHYGYGVTSQVWDKVFGTVLPTKDRSQDRTSATQMGPTSPTCNSSMKEKQDNNAE